MKKILTSLYTRIAAIFLVLLLVMVAVQMWLAVNSANKFILESDQKLNLNLAQDLANEFKPFLQDSINFAEIKHTMHYLMVMNPRVEIYLVDGDGKILAYFIGPAKKLQKEFIDLAPVKKFLASHQQTPILGDDPRSANSRKTFSVAPIQIPPDTPGYIYVILLGEQYDSAAQMIAESHILRLTTVGIMIAFMITGILGLFLFSKITRRFRRMSENVSLFEQGRYDIRLDASGDDEVSALSRSFNQMAATITANMEELKRTDDLRRELVANVSHDLRSPLASIQGYLETILIKEKSLSEEVRRKYLNTILENSKMLSRLVAELFELSKLDARQIEPKEEPFSLPELAQDVVMKFMPIAEKAGITLKNISDKNLPLVKADIALIERVLSNLIDNALRYTPKGGTVAVELARNANGSVNVQVTDSGPGIPEQELPRIFERFYRLEKSRARAGGGSGLGLAIVKKIIELHNSTIEVKSELNVGTTFSFALSG